ncbi:MAG: M48 family metalloprotease [Candidatus Krumholzibacteriota bacterium]|nr:M48 family metalloprotease [Candidatus Krumholzibacteriota bacterium]
MTRRLSAVSQAALTLTIAAVLVVAGCATTGINKGQVNLISSAEEVQMGDSFSVEVEKQYTMLDDPAVVAYVDRVGQRIVKVNDRQDITFHFNVIVEDQMNAFAVPGGYIYVYTGLLKAMDDESQLAGVIAHEIGHVAARHSTERLTAMYGVQILAQLLLGNNPNAYANLVANIFSTTGFLAYSRSNEFEADELGLRYANAAGYDPDGYMELLGKFQTAETREPSKLESWLSTHPPTSDRIARVKGQAAGFTRRGQLRNRDVFLSIKSKLK